MALFGIGSRIDYRNPARPPLLLIAGEKDRTVPAPMVRTNFRRQQRAPTPTAYREFAGRSHWLCNEPGWEEIADVCATRAVVVSNPMLLDGILRNLVRNAVKYTEPGGRILIGCRHAGADVRIDVYDTGIGLAPEHLPKIFEAFQRVDSSRGDGLGIGLFIVRRAIQLLGHRIEVKSVAGRGSRFSVFASAAQ